MPLSNPGGVFPELSGLGIIYFNGKKREDGVKFNLKANVETHQSKVLSQPGKTTRTTGISYSGQLTFRKTSPWLITYINNIREHGEAQPFTLQFIVSDPGSDYYKKHGAQRLTAIDCMLTGDIPLIEADADGDIINETLDFTARDIIA